MSRLSKEPYKFAPEWQEYIRRSLDPVESKKGVQLDCLKLIHPGQTCNQYAFLKLRLIGKSCAKLQMLVNLLPNICRNYKTLHKWETIKRIIKSYIRACLWLTLITALPPITLCHFSRLFGRTDWVVACCSFYFSSLFVAIDTKSHIYETGLFFAPKALELIWGMMLVRGLLGSKQAGPILSGAQVEKISLALAFGILALVIGINQNAKKQEQNNADKHGNQQSHQGPQPGGHQVSKPQEKIPVSGPVYNMLVYFWDVSKDPSKKRRSNHRETQQSQEQSREE